MHNQNFTTTCRVCGQEIKQKRNDALYCSAKCKQQAYRDRKFSGQFFTCAKMIAQGKVLEHEKMIEQGESDRQEILLRPEFQGTENYFEKTVNQVYYFLKLSTLLHRIFSLRNGETVEKKVFKMIQAEYSTLNNLEIDEPFLRKHTSNTFGWKINAFFSRLSLIFSVARDNPVKIEENDPFFDEILAVYPKIQDYLNDSPT
jgi:hypothetical protein